MSLATAAPYVVACWPLDEASGTRNDSVGSSHLTDNNTVASATGVFSNAADFERSNSESLTVASNSTLETGDIKFMLRCWVKLESKEGSYMTAIGKVQSDGSTAEYYLLYRSSVDRFEFLVNTSASVRADNFGAPSTGTWYLIHCWHDSVANEIGISVNAGTANTTAHSAGVTVRTSAQFALGTLGSYSDSNSYWDGLIDDPLLMKDYILDATERTEDYNSGTGKAFSTWAGGGATTRGRPFGQRGTAFNGGRTWQGIINP